MSDGWPKKVVHHELTDLVEGYDHREQEYSRPELRGATFHLVRHFPLAAHGGGAISPEVLTDAMEHDSDSDRADVLASNKGLREAMKSAPHSVPPLVVQKHHPDPTLDGNHRKALGLHAGRTHHPAYVTDAKPAKTAAAPHLDLYHRTTPEAADAIRSSRSMRSNEGNDVYFSDREHSDNTEGYGHGVVHVRVPEHMAELDDEFPDGEQHFRLDRRKLQPHHFVSVRKQASSGASDAVGHPNSWAIAQTQEKMRKTFPDLYRRLPEDPDEADEVAGRVFAHLGHPQAHRAFVVPHRDPSQRQSQAVFDGNTGAPGVALHPDRWDHGTLAHEAAHHADFHHSGVDPSAPHGDEQHGGDFPTHYRRALEAVHPEAAEFFGEHHPIALRNAARVKELTQRKQAVMTSPDHHREYPETWNEDYRSYAREKPHAAAVGQAQDHLRTAVPRYSMPLPDDPEEAAPTIQTMLRRAGHPQADKGFVMRHPQPEKGISCTVHDKEGGVGAALHPDRWDYGTLAHETAHLTHQHELGVSSGKGLSDEELHGPGFVEHYKRHLSLLGKGAPDELHDAYHSAIGRIQTHAALGPDETPSARIFGPTHGLDRRLFDGEHLKPAVSAVLMFKWHYFCRYNGLVDPDAWSIVYFAGSEASEWTSANREGNNDFDILVGVDALAFDQTNPGSPLAGQGQVDLSAALTERLKNDPRMVDPNFHLPGEGRGDAPWDQTWYVNAGSYRIQDIKPYAAYDVTHDRWAVKPPHLPGWSMKDFPEGPGLEEFCWGFEKLVRATLEMPEPYRHQEGYALWHYVHDERALAFGPQGEGWWDLRNVLEKWLDQKGLMQELWTLMHEAAEDPHLLDAPTDWSNTPVLAHLLAFNDPRWPEKVAAMCATPVSVARFS